MNPRPYYADELVRLFQADCTNLSFLASNSIQHVVTSSPYNLGKDSPG
jgi:DNA modification methylase